MILSKSIELDVSRPNLFEPFVMAEDDINSHVLIVKLVFAEDRLYTPPREWYTAKLHYCRADGTTGTVTGICRTSTWDIKIEIPESVIALDDIVSCDICLNRQETLDFHSISVVNGEIVVTTTTKTVDRPLRSGLFKIDSIYRVIISE